MQPRRDGNLLANGATHATVTTNPDGSFELTPDANHNGPVSLTYSVVDGHGGSVAGSLGLVLDAVNDAPDAVNDGTPTPIAVGGIMATTLTSTLLANDSDIDHDTLTITGGTNGAHGTVTVVDGALVYAPQANYSGADSFSYTISDGHGGTDTANVDINVGSANGGPTAVADSGNVNEDAQVTLNLITNDTDPDLPNGDSLKIVSVSGNQGSIAISLDGKSITYTADNDQFDLLATNATMQDVFTYTMRDASGLQSQSTVTMTIKGMADGNNITGATSPDSIVVGANASKNTSGGEDTVRAGNGNDTVFGGDGADQLFGEKGNDSLDGGNSVDRLFGGPGDDKMLGGGGDDTLQGDQGSDVLTGGPGNDLFVFVGDYASTERDVITDLAAGDHILLSGLTIASTSVANLAGSASASDVLLTMSNGSSVVLADVSLATWNSGVGWLGA